MIHVTKTYLPELEDYKKILNRAFKNNWLTNRGELAIELEESLSSYLDLRDYKILATNNGTTPLQIALKLLGKGGEVITTPFSYVATTSSIVWENCTPVFVDIDPVHWTIDEHKIEEIITDKTTCILATHVFGNPCNIEEIERIAKKHSLYVIYDAAHCFDVEYQGKSIFEYGDLSTCSFHATKLFHTGEGGAIFTKKSELFNKVYFSHNFGHDGHLDFHGLGINAKISELQAAMGLSILPHMQTIICERQKVTEMYYSKLNLENLETLTLRKGTKWNYSYFPIVLESEEKLLEIEKALNEVDVFPRRYFYPSLNKLPYLEYKSMPIAESISKRILCLPLYVGLSELDINLITDTINNVL